MGKLAKWWQIPILRWMWALGICVNDQISRLFRQSLPNFKLEVLEKVAQIVLKMIIRHFKGCSFLYSIVQLCHLPVSQPSVFHWSVWLSWWEHGFCRERLVQRQSSLVPRLYFVCDVNVCCGQTTADKPNTRVSLCLLHNCKRDDNQLNHYITSLQL